MGLTADDQQYFKALTEASIVSKSDTEGIITYVNDNFCKVTGYSREELLGRSHNIFRHPDNPDSIYKEMWDTIKSGKIWRERMVNLKKDGSDFIAESTIIPLIGEDGQIKEYMAIRNDVTDIVMLKREIFTKEQEKVEQEKIKEAQKSFLLVFTHELKTPLNAIINFSKYIKKALQDPTKAPTQKLINLLDSVLGNATDMLNNIMTILEISKLNAQKLHYDYSMFNASALIEEILKKYDSLIEANSIQVSLKSDTELFINSDMHRVEQIVSNILSNAIKYGDNQIVIILEEQESRTLIAVEDNGPGIKDKEGVFELYAQEDENLIQRKGKGTGIGLYFIKLLCNDLGIQYQLKDRIPQPGTRFELIFDNRRNNGKGNDA